MSLFLVLIHYYFIEYICIYICRSRGVRETPRTGQSDYLYKVVLAAKTIYNYKGKIGLGEKISEIVDYSQVQSRTDASRARVKIILYA